MSSNVTLMEAVLRFTVHYNGRTLICMRQFSSRFGVKVMYIRKRSWKVSN